MANFEIAVTQNDLSSVSFAELRDRLKARADGLDTATDLDIREVLRHLIGLPDRLHTTDSVEALIQLSRNLFYAALPAEMLQAASHGSRLAAALNEKGLLGRARNKEACALVDLGEFAEATIANAEAWSLAREVGNRTTEMFAIWGFGTICAAMGQVPMISNMYVPARAWRLSFRVGEVNSLAVICWRIIT